MEDERERSEANQCSVQRRREKRREERNSLVFRLLRRSCGCEIRSNGSFVRKIECCLCPCEIRSNGSFVQKIECCLCPRLIGYTKGSDGRDEGSGPGFRRNGRA